MMGVTIVVGAQWGDEGKGKIVDFYAEKADLVARFQGGNNAGHTLVLKDSGQTRKLVLHLIPSGVLREGTKCVIGSGVVIDPETLIDELEALEAFRGQPLSPDLFRIARNAHLILPYHCELDRARELALGDGKIGTTGKGIGPCYEDRAARRGFTVGDLMQGPAMFRKKLEQTFWEKASLLDHYGVPYEERATFQQILDRCFAVADQIRPYVGGVRADVAHAIKNGANVLMEGAQGTMLDLGHGTYPYVTSSNTVSAAACVSLGFGPKEVTRVVGVCKAYTTRVGAGPFPTELNGLSGEILRTKGAEFGATTGRPRRCGWLDLPALKYAVALNGITELAITKLDILSGFEEVKLCVAYSDGDHTDTRITSDGLDLENVTPVFETFKGWTTERSPRTYHSLPKAAKAYLSRIEGEVGVKIKLVSVGPGRDEAFAV